MRRASDWRARAAAGPGRERVSVAVSAPGALPRAAGLGGRVPARPPCGRERKQARPSAKRGSGRPGRRSEGNSAEVGPFPPGAAGGKGDAVGAARPLRLGTASGGCPARRAGFMPIVPCGRGGGRIVPPRRFSQRLRCRARLARRGAFAGVACVARGTGKAALPVRARPRSAQKAGAVARGRSRATGRKRHLRPVRRRCAYRPKRSVTRKSRPASGA